MNYGTTDFADKQSHLVQQIGIQRRALRARHRCGTACGTFHHLTSRAHDLAVSFTAQIMNRRLLACDVVLLMGNVKLCYFNGEKIEITTVNGV